MLYFLERYMCERSINVGVLQIMGLFLAAGVFGYLTRRIGDKFIKEPDRTKDEKPAGTPEKAGEPAGTPEKAEEPAGTPEQDEK